MTGPTISFGFIGLQIFRRGASIHSNCVPVQIGLLKLMPPDVNNGTKQKKIPAHQVVPVSC